MRYDKVTNGLPRESRRGDAPRGPAIWDAKDAVTFGQFPKGFLRFFSKCIGVERQELAHFCSGAVPAGEGRVRLDVRGAVSPTVIGDATKAPFADETFRGILIDPPYWARYSRDLYNLRRYPRPSQLLREASRLVVPGGIVGILHFHVPRPRGRLELERVIGITTGCGYRIRALTIFRKRQEDLFDETRR